MDKKNESSQENALYVRNFYVEDGVLTLTVQEKPISLETASDDAGDYVVVLEDISAAGRIENDLACCFILRRGILGEATYIRFKDEQQSSIFFHKLVEGMKDHYSGANQVQDGDPEDYEPGDRP